MRKIESLDWLGDGWIAASVGITYWHIASLIQFYFDAQVTFQSALFPTDGHELFIRSIVLLTIVVFSSYADYSVIRIRQAEESRRDPDNIRSDEDQVKRMLSGTITAISRAVEVRDPYTAGHQRRVAELSVAIATLLGMDKEELEEIYMGALIHDIGKIQVPTEILVNPSMLNENEFSLIKGHTLVGHNILEDSEVPNAVLSIIRHHHERLDGSGYPDGISGDQISKQAKIVAVADVVEAMSSDRPYRAALGMDRAAKEITDGRGTLFDSKVVDACISLIVERGFVFQKA